MLLPAGCAHKDKLQNLEPGSAQTLGRTKDLGADQFTAPSTTASLTSSSGLQLTPNSTQPQQSSGKGRGKKGKQGKEQNKGQKGGSNASSQTTSGHQDSLLTAMGRLCLSPPFGFAFGVWLILVAGCSVQSPNHNFLSLTRKTRN